MSDGYVYNNSAKFKNSLRFMAVMRSSKIYSLVWELLRPKGQPLKNLAQKCGNL